MTKKIEPTMYRQGDVLITRVNHLPELATELPRDEARGVILAEGEVTGHAHRIHSRHAQLYRTEVDARYMRVTAPVALQHEEHASRGVSARRAASPGGGLNDGAHEDRQAHSYAGDRVRRASRGMARDRLAHRA